MVAVFNHGEIMTYMVSPALMETFLEAQDDLAVLKEIENMDTKKPLRSYSISLSKSSEFYVR